MVIQFTAAFPHHTSKVNKVNKQCTFATSVRVDIVPRPIRNLNLHYFLCNPTILTV